MGSSSESIFCEPRPATVARGQRRDDVSGRAMTLVVPAAPPSNRLVVVTANSLCNKLPPSVYAAVVVAVPPAQAATTTDGRVDGIATAGRLVTTPRGWHDVSRGCRLGWRAAVSARGWRRARPPDFPRSRQKTPAARAYLTPTKVAARETRRFMCV